MSNKLIKILFAIISICFLTGCTTNQPPIEKILQTPTLFIQTPHSTVTPYPPPTKRPAQNSVVETLQTEFISTESQIEIYPTRTPTVFDSAYATLWAPFLSCGDDYDERLSPSHNWYLCSHGDWYEVMNREGISWQFSPQDLFGIEYYGDISLLNWSPYDKFLYIALANPMDGPHPFTANANALFRMDLSDGKVVTILGTIDIDAPINHVNVVSISPTSRYLAYFNEFTQYDSPKQKKLHIVDLHNNEDTETLLPIEYDQIGEFVWSEDGKLLTYKLYPTRGNDPCKYSYSIRFLDLNDSSSITFIKMSVVDECSDGYNEFDVISVSSDSVELKKNNEIWIYNIETQKLKIQATVTPSP